MSRKIVNVVETDDGRKPDATNYEDAVYWDSERELAEELKKGEASIIPL